MDLSDHLTWLQSGRRITYGPVPMEPGPPGSRHATRAASSTSSGRPRANYISNEFDEPMPYAFMFALGGIAFHGGSLTTPSHGCVHLTIGSAHYYHDTLPIGAEGTWRSSEPRLPWPCRLPSPSGSTPFPDGRPGPYGAEGTSAPQGRVRASGLTTRATVWPRQQDRGSLTLAHRGCECKVVVDEADGG